MKNIEILNQPSKDEPFLIINKPSGLPTAPLSSEDNNNLLSYACLQFPQIKDVKGKKSIEYGLIHRIDTVTSGLVLIALTQQAYDFIINEQKADRFIKKYRAECDVIENQSLPGFPDTELFFKSHFSSKTIESYFRYYGTGNKEVRPVEKDSKNKYIKSKIGKSVLYSTKINLISDDFFQDKNKSVLVECEITNGFRHQVRCHLAWLGLPIQNDSIYNIKNDCSDSVIKFTASGLQFINPATHKNMIFSI